MNRLVLEPEKDYMLGMKRPGAPLVDKGSNAD